MIGSLIVGSVVVFLGGCCVVAGIALAASEMFRKRQATTDVTLEDFTNLVTAVKELLVAFGKLPASIQFVILGTVLIAGGVWILETRPF